MKKAISLLLALLLLFTAGCGLSPEQQIIRGNTSGVYDPAYDFELTYNYASYINDDSVVVPLSASDQSMFYYNNHIKTGDENDLSWAYDEIIYGVTHLSNPNEEYANVSDLVLPKEITEEQLWKVCFSISSDHPELWYFRLPDLNCYQIHPENSRLVYFSYSHDLSDIPSMDAQLKAASDQLVSSFKGIRNAEDLCAAVAGSLCETTVIGDAGFSDTRHSSMYNILLEHTGICFAFAQAYCYLLQKLGIPSFVAAGGDAGEISHTWSVVPINGSYRYVDAYHMAKEYHSVDHPVSRYLLYEDAGVLLQINENFFVCDGYPIAGSPIDAPILSDGSPLKDSYL